MKDYLDKKYKEGFSTNVEHDTILPGINEEIIKIISAKKNEPTWLTEWRLKAFAHWQTLSPPNWAIFKTPDIDYQAISYFSAPKKYKSLDEVDPEILATFKKLGVPLHEQKMLAGVAVDAIFDSVSVGTTFKDELKKKGVIFCSFGEAVQEYPDLVQKYLGTVVSYKDNFFASLNAAAFSDGSFVYIPKNVKCPMELSTYFRMNADKTGQMERTLIITEEGSYVSYLEGCFLANTPIWTPDGVKEIQDIKIHDKVFDHQGNIQSVKSLMVRKYQGDIYHIKHLGSQDYIHATSEHPFWAIKRNDVLSNRKQRYALPEISNKKFMISTPRWLQAKNLEKGDFVFIPKVSTILSSITLYEAELLGFYLAEGSSYFNNANKQFTNQFSFNINERDYANRIEFLVHQIFGQKVYFTEDKDKNKNGLGVSFYSEKAHNWFIYHVGKEALNKKLSKELINMSEKCIEVFIDSYLKGDGNIFYRKTKLKNGETSQTMSKRLCTSSKMLVQDIVLLLARVNIFAISVKRSAGSDCMHGRKINRQESWQIIWNPNQKFNQGRKTCDGYWVPIKEIYSEKQENFVYNFEVENTNTYLAQGVAVHNCSAPQKKDTQLHAAVVELVALDNSEIKYSTMQNWYPGNEEGLGGIYNFVTKRGECRGNNSKISWTQVETGSAITWKYPSIILRGDNSVGEFFSVAVSNHKQIADTGTKMIHLGKDTKSTILSKGISALKGENAYRGLVRMGPNADKSRNYTRCDNLVIGQEAKAYALPVIETYNPSCITEHEAFVSKVSEEQLFYAKLRGLSEKEAVSLLVNGFCKEVMKKLPMEFAIEAQKLLEVALED